MRASEWVAVGWVLAGALAAQGQELFFDSFVQPPSQNWDPWEPDEIGDDTCVWCGPVMLSQSQNHPWLPYGDSDCARQERAQPFWYGALHDVGVENIPAGMALRLSAYQFEDATSWTLYPYGTVTPPHPDDTRELHNHDQVEGWIGLMDRAQTEVFLLGVHAHWASPEPVVDWYRHVSWYTTTDGWHTTTFPRAQGFRFLEIVVHEYTGRAGDVEFYINGTLYGQGHRTPGLGHCNGVPVSQIGIGSNPNFVPEDYLSNSYEHFWYDGVTLSAEPDNICNHPRYDVDGNGAVDLEDFGVFQSCYSGMASMDCACRCMDADDNQQIDRLDWEAFVACWSGPAVRADPDCDTSSPPP